MSPAVPQQISNLKLKRWAGGRFFNATQDITFITSVLKKLTSVCPWANYSSTRGLVHCQQACITLSQATICWAGIVEDTFWLSTWLSWPLSRALGDRLLRRTYLPEAWRVLQWRHWRFRRWQRYWTNSEPMVISSWSLIHSGSSLHRSSHWNLCS